MHSVLGRSKNVKEVIIRNIMFKKVMSIHSETKKVEE